MELHQQFFNVHHTMFLKYAEISRCPLYSQAAFISAPLARRKP